MNIGDKIVLHIPRTGDIDQLNATVHKKDINEKKGTGKLTFLVPGSEDIFPAPMLYCIWQSGSNVQTFKMNITGIEAGFMIHVSIPWKPIDPPKRTSPAAPAKKSSKKSGK